MPSNIHLEQSGRMINPFEADEDTSERSFNAKEGLVLCGQQCARISIVAIFGLL